MKNAILKELTNKGYNAELRTVNKNNVILDAILIHEAGSNLSPTIYINDLLTLDLDEAVNQIISTYEANKTPGFDFDASVMLDSKFILANATITLQRAGSQPVVKRDTDYAGIEQIIRVRINDEASYKLTPEMLDKAGLDEEEVWNKAFSNMVNEIKVSSMAVRVAEMTGMPLEVIEEQFGGKSQYIVSNTREANGAAGMLDRTTLKLIADKLETDTIIILPSSIHECIVCAYDGNKEAYDEMVRDVNSTQVDPTEQLSDEAYIISF